MAIIAILAALLLPALSRGKDSARTIQCLNNMKQLTVGWVLYAADHRDQLVHNWVLGAGNSPAGSWATGNVQWTTGITNVNDLKAGALFGYVTALDLFRCPNAALRSGRVQVRTVSMMERMGGADTADAIQYGVFDSSSDLGAAYFMFKHISDINNPHPAAAAVFVDESQNTVDDSIYALTFTTWKNAPTIRHSKGATFSFADGHVERWKWMGLAKENGYGVTPVGTAQTADFQKLLGADVQP